MAMTTMLYHEKPELRNEGAVDEGRSSPLPGRVSTLIPLTNPGFIRFLVVGLGDIRASLYRRAFPCCFRFLATDSCSSTTLIHYPDLIVALHHHRYPQSQQIQHHGLPVLLRHPQARQHRAVRPEGHSRRVDARPGFR